MAPLRVTLYVHKTQITINKIKISCTNAQSIQSFPPGYGTCSVIMEKRPTKLLSSICSALGPQKEAGVHFVGGTVTIKEKFKLEEHICNSQMFGRSLQQQKEQQQQVPHCIC